MEIEQAYFKNAYEDLVAQSTKISLYTDLGKETYITLLRTSCRSLSLAIPPSAENFRSKGGASMRSAFSPAQSTMTTALEFHLGPSGRRPRPSASACRSIMMTISEDQW